jgi:hypothetical protein
MITPDLIFSYWIFAWFLLFYIFQNNLCLNLKHWLNPYYVIVFALIENIISLVYITGITRVITFFIFYLLMLILFKVIPLYLLLKSGNYAGYYLEKIVVFIGVFIVYNLYLMFRGTNFLKIYIQINDSLIKKEHTTPFFYLLNFLNSFR